jgi:type IV fimbrial biogenesis protein FimT
MRPRGHTLWELVTVITVLAVVATLASPDFGRLRASSAVTSGADRLLGALHFARSRAILRGVPTVVCLSQDGEHCVGRGARQAPGWIVFENTHAEFMPVRDPGEPILRRHRLEVPAALRATRSAVTYWPTARAGMTSSFEFCSKIAGVQPRAVIVSQTGRPRLRMGPARGSRVPCGP